MQLIYVILQFGTTIYARIDRNIRDAGNYVSVVSISSYFANILHEAMLSAEALTTAAFHIAIATCTGHGPLANTSAMVGAGLFEALHFWARSR